MSQFISSVDVGEYTISFHRDGNVWVETKGARDVRMIKYMLCDPYDGESRMDSDTLIPFSDYVKHEWLKVCPHMKYAYDKCGDVVHADRMAMITYVNKHPFLEPLLNNPHDKKYTLLIYMWEGITEPLPRYKRHPNVLKQAIRNFHDPSIELNMRIPLSKAHEPQYKWLMNMINEGTLDELITTDLSTGWLSEKDMNYVIKLHAKAPREFRLDEEWIALESYVNYRRMLEEAVYEGLLPDNVLKDTYWVYPSPTSYYARCNRVADVLNAFYDGQESHEEFDSHMERYKKYSVDITVDGFRFYTTTSREGWISHSDALKQCCYRAKYYSHENNILTFVEKDGVPYGTIDYSLNEHQVFQARIDQSDYSKSSMPADVVKLFMKHVVHMLENK